MLNADNYKGIFYGKDKINQYYEGGAHFKYEDLVYALKNLLKSNLLLQKEESPASIEINNNTKPENNSKLEIDTRSNSNDKKSLNNGRFNTLESGSKRKVKLNDLITINHYDILNRKIIINTVKKDILQRTNKETIKRNSSLFKNKETNNILKINFDKISLKLNDNKRNKNFETIVPTENKGNRNNSFIRKNNLPVIQSSYFNKMDKNIIPKFHLKLKRKEENSDSKYNFNSPSRNYLMNYKSNNALTSKKKEKFSDNNINAKYEEIMARFMKNNHFASIEIMNHIEKKSGNDKFKQYISNMKNRENTLKIYTNIFDEKQNSSREKKTDGINIFK